MDSLVMILEGMTVVAMSNKKKPTPYMEPIIKEGKNFITRRINCQTGASHFCFQQKQNINESLFI